MYDVSTFQKSRRARAHLGGGGQGSHFPLNDTMPYAVCGRNSSRPDHLKLDFSARNVC